VLQKPGAPATKSPAHITKRFTHKGARLGRRPKYAKVAAPISIQPGGILKRLRILIVEDERKVARALKEGLEGESYSVHVAHTGEEGFFVMNSQPFDLVVLDVMLPGRSGIEILSALRLRGPRIPVLLLTARDAVEDRVSGLDAGADDYLVKPFAFPELLARVRALLRRGRAEPSTALAVQDLQMDLVSRTVRRGDQKIDLTAKEFEVLEYLLRHQGKVVSREMLARDVWKETMRHTPLDNVIDVHMTRLRRKIDDKFPSKLVHTVRGVGFVLKSEP
jgi:two-component system, OmpR family, copper resistance phosphate regulon response regulator CusR